MLQVTLDTNACGLDELDRIRAATEGMDVNLAPTTVSLREWPRLTSPEGVVPETAVWDESVYDSGAVYDAAPVVYETLTIGESALDAAVLGDDDAPQVFALPRLWEAAIADGGKDGLKALPHRGGETPTPRRDDP